MKASATDWPPLVSRGLLKDDCTTSTDMPGSMRMPLMRERCLVVILNLGILCFVFVGRPQPGLLCGDSKEAWGCAATSLYGGPAKNLCGKMLLHWIVPRSCVKPIYATLSTENFAGFHKQDEA